MSAEFRLSRQIRDFPRGLPDQRRRGCGSRTSGPPPGPRRCPRGRVTVRVVRMGLGAYRCHAKRSRTNTKHGQIETSFINLYYRAFPCFDVGVALEVTS